MTDTTSQATPHILEVGQTAPNLSVTSIHQQPSTLDQEMGDKGLLVYVIRGTWCPFCVHQMVATRARYKHYTERGVDVQFIIPEEDYKITSFVQTVSRPLPFGLHADPNRKLAAYFTGQTGTEQARMIGIYLLNTERQVVWKYLGHEDNYPSHRTILDAIEDTLDTTEPAQPQPASPTQQNP